MWAAGEPSCTWSLLKESVRRQTQRKLCGSLYFRPTLCHIGRAGVKNIKILNYWKNFSMKWSLYNSPNKIVLMNCTQLPLSGVNHLCINFPPSFSSIQIKQFYGCWYHRSKEECDSQIHVVSSRGSGPQRPSSITTFLVPPNVSFVLSIKDSLALQPPRHQKLASFN